MWITVNHPRVRRESIKGRQTYNSVTRMNQTLGYKWLYGCSQPGRQSHGPTQRRSPHQRMGQAGVYQAHAGVGQDGWTAQGQRQEAG